MYPPQGGNYGYPASSYGYENEGYQPYQMHQAPYEDGYYYGNGGGPPGNLQQSPPGYKRGQQQYEPYYGGMYHNSYGATSSHQMPAQPVKPKTFSASKSQAFAKPQNLECIPSTFHQWTFLVFLTKSFEKCKDSQGSRIVQQCFEDGSDSEKDQIYDSIRPHALELMKDVFGNYVIQKILEQGTKKHKEGIYETMKGRIVELTLNTYGCRVVQKALDEFKAQRAILLEIIGELRGKVLETLKDQNGNHVTQKCFETVPIDDLDFIVKDVESDVI